MTRAADDGTEPMALEPRGETAPSVEGAGVKPGAISALLAEVLAGDAGGAGAGWDGALRPGLVIDHFELVRELGRGGFGVVYEAIDRRLGRRVAFKAVRAGGAGAVREERLLREAEAAARLAHPGIVTLLDVGRSVHGPYLVLELLTGETLGHRLASGPLPVDEALRVAEAVAAGLAHAHAHGVVHRDLTPENVHLGVDGQVKVLDLGMAHAFGRRRAEGGTPAFMAPEQWRGAPEDERTDVYALGVLLHRMLVGGPEPQGGGPAAEPRPLPPLEIPELPGLGALVARMLARDPVERPRDGAAVLAALSSLRARTASAPVAVRVLHAGPRVWRGAPGRLVAVAVASALLGLGAGIAIARRGPLAPPGAAIDSLAILPFEDQAPGKPLGYLGEGLAGEIIDALARDPGLRVIGRASAFALQGKGHGPAAVAHQLEVGAVLQGTIHQVGGRVQVAAELWSNGDERVLWSHRYDRAAADLLALQDEIAAAVAKALQRQSHPESSRGARTTSTEAYTRFLVGRQALRLGARDSPHQARQELERAIALDPDYAAAWSALALALAEEADGAVAVADADELRQRALEAADRAVAMAPELADAYSTRSFLRSNLQHDWPGARSDIQRALTLAPGDAYALRRSGALSQSQGRLPESIAALRQAVDRDPLAPGAWLLLGASYMAAGELPRARAALDRLLEIAPQSRLGQITLSIVTLLDGKPAEALARAEAIQDEQWRLFGVALAQHQLSHEVDSRHALDSLAARYGTVAAYQIGAVHAFRGDREEAFTWLERAREQHDGGLGFAKVDPLLAPIRSDPRWASLLHALALPVD